MKVNNGYVEVEDTAEGIVMISTEIDASIPTGSRTCTVIMPREQFAGLVAQLPPARHPHA